MKKSLLELYALAVCFVSLVCFVIVLGQGIYDLIEITNPEFTLEAYEYKKHQSNEAFFFGKGRLEVEEPTKQRKESYQAALRAEQREGAQSLTMNAIVLVINGLVFVLHWLLARRVRVASAVN